MIKELLEKLLTVTFWEGLLIAVGSWLAMAFAPIGPFVFAVFVFVLCDKYTGTKAAVKRGEDRNSRAMARTIEKLIVYVLALLLCEVARKVFAPMVPFTWAAALLIIQREFKSNSENIKVLTGVDLWPSIKMYWDKLNPNK